MLIAAGEMGCCGVLGMDEAWSCVVVARRDEGGVEASGAEEAAAEVEVGG